MSDLEKSLKKAESIIEDLLKLIDVPPRSDCSCHIAPPCNDCVEHGFTREILSDANDFISSLPKS